MPRAVHLLAVFAVGLILLNCGGAFRSSELAFDPLEETEHIVYRNVTLKASLAVLEVQTSEVSGLMQLGVKVKNMLSRDLNVEYQIRWLKADGFDCGESAWMPLPLMTGEIKTFQRVATSKNAADYRLIFRLANK